MDLKHLVEELLGELARVSKADSVVGTVRDAGKAKVLPLAKVSIGFGTVTGGAGGKAKNGQGESDADASMGGAGGAVVIEPKAFVVVSEDGVPHLLALNDGKAPAIRRGIKIVPDAGTYDALAEVALPRLGGKTD